METESEEREACLRRHRERDGARWASPTVDQTQARLEHNASYRHTHLQQLATNPYLPTVPHSAGLSRKKHHCPAVPHGGLIVPHFKCACVRRPEPPHMASPTPPWLIHLRTLVSVVRLGINFHFLKLKHKLHNIFPMNIIILCLSCNFFKCPAKMSRVSCIDFYSGWQVCSNRQRRLESEMAEESYTRFFFSAISIYLPYIRSCNVCQPCAMDLSATDSSTMAWRSTQQRRIAAESTEEREARLHQLSVTQRQRIAAESTEEREARLQQLRILPNRNNHQDLLINCHSKYIPILLVLIDVFHYAIIEAFVMLFH